MGIKRRNRKHNSAAIYGHFTGAKRLPGKAEGNITVFWFDHGWFWFIPLADGTTSVGAVCWPYYMKTRRTSPDEFFLDTIALCPALAERLRDAKLTAPATATGNYSYVADRTMGRNYLMLGDAYVHRPGVFHRRAARHAKRFRRRRYDRDLPRPPGAGRRGAQALRRNDAARAGHLLVAHLPGDHSRDPRALHGAVEPLPGSGSADLRACGRYLPARRRGARGCSCSGRSTT